LNYKYKNDYKRTTNYLQLNLIVFANEKDIQDRDKAIMQLYDALRLHENDHPVIKKYEEFVTKTRTIYGE
jgi:hypothetical protein